MLEILYRIYQIPSEEQRKLNKESNLNWGIYSSTSKQENTELLTDCLICADREEFKSIMRDEYGKNVSFRYSKNLKEGDVYCIIIGEKCYDTEKYFNKVTYKCDYCGAEITTYIKKHIFIDDWTIKQHLNNDQEYSKKRFCSSLCKEKYIESEIDKFKSADEDYVNGLWISRNDFINNDLAGYIYKITKKSTGEFYVGQTVYLPIFRWGQHLKTERFPVNNILDYNFEVIELVPKNENLLEREKYWIQKCFKECPEKSLNISQTAELRG